jgi:hypothetical protein
VLTWTPTDGSRAPLAHLGPGGTTRVEVPPVQAVLLADALSLGLARPIARTSCSGAASYGPVPRTSRGKSLRRIERAYLGQDVTSAPL